MPDKKKSKAKVKAKASNNIYTAILGLSVFALISAVAVVCWVSNDYYETVFKVVGTDLPVIKSR